MRLVLILLGMLLTQPVLAEWVEVARDSVGGTYYIDPATIRKTDNGRRVWEMATYEEPRQVEGRSHLSANGVREYDCTGERARQLSITLFPERMLRGSPFDLTRDPGNWRFPAPSSVGGATLKAVCNAPLPK